MYTEELDILRKLRMIVEKTETDYVLGYMTQDEHDRIHAEAARIVTDLENKLDSVKKKKWWKH